MKKFTQQEVDSFPRNEVGFIICPTGDYSDIKKFCEGCSFSDGCSFSRGCSFSEGCSFRERCSFSKRCSFGMWCSFGEGCSFRDGCSFRERCSFATLPICLRFNLGKLSDVLTNELMHRDSCSHPKPKMFKLWAVSEGKCPYSLPVERMHFFDERKSAWKNKWRRMRDYDLIVKICKEKKWIVPNFE